MEVKRVFNSKSERPKGAGEREVLYIFAVCVFKGFHFPAALQLQYLPDTYPETLMAIESTLGCASANSPAVKVACLCTLPHRGNESAVSQCFQRPSLSLQ